MSVGPKVKCLACGDVIQSTHRHDFKRCKCGAIFVDGGSDYLRTGFPPNKTPDESYEIMDDKPSELRTHNVTTLKIANPVEKARDIAEEAMSDFGYLIDKLRDIQKCVYHTHAGRPISVALTELETSYLWLETAYSKILEELK